MLLVRLLSAEARVLLGPRLSHAPKPRKTTRLDKTSTVTPVFVSSGETTRARAGLCSGTWAAAPRAFEGAHHSCWSSFRTRWHRRRTLPWMAPRRAARARRPCWRWPRDGPPARGASECELPQLVLPRHSARHHLMCGRDPACVGLGRARERGSPDSGSTLISQSKQRWQRQPLAAPPAPTEHQRGSLLQRGHPSAQRGVTIYRCPAGPVATFPLPRPRASRAPAHATAV